MKGKSSSLFGRHLAAFRFVCTVIVPLLWRTRRRPVIFSKFAGIGDIICTIPAALELKRRHPGAEFIYHCHAEFACLPVAGGVTERVTSFAHIGVVGYWYRWLLGGFYQFASDDDRPGVVPKEIYLKDFGRQFGVELTENHPRLQVAPAALAIVKARLAKAGFNAGPLVVIHPGPSWPVREWPQESWRRLTEELRQRGFTQIVQVGAAQHLGLGAIEPASCPGIVSLVDELTLAESVALISLANLFVGIDSGMLHIAAAVGTPAVGLWGPTAPQLRFAAAAARSFVVSPVECQGCHHRVPRGHWITGCPVDIRCMKEIAVATVAAACLNRLAESAPRP